MLEKIMKQYYNRLAKEGWLNAFFAALIVGFSVMLLTAFAFWFTAFQYPWIAFIVFAAVTAGCTPLFFFTKFKPSKKQIAKRVDELGLEERLLTMAELEGDDSYIARKQREDAKAALANIQAKWLKIVASIPLVVGASVMMVCGVAMTTVAIASANGQLSSGQEIIGEATKPEPITYAVEFLEDGGGIIEGEILQIIEEGGTIEAVIAVPDEGWYIEEWRWEIGGEEFTLTETDVFFVEDLFVETDIVITAVFSEAGDGSGGGGGGEGEGESEDSENQEADADEGEPSDEPSEGEGEEGEDGNENPEGENDPDSDNAGGGQGGTSHESDQIKDGKTDYGGTIYSEAVSDAEDELESNDEIPDDWKDIISDYYENIKK